jgi:hypothetical protein
MTVFHFKSKVLFSGSDRPHPQRREAQGARPTIKQGFMKKSFNNNEGMIPMLLRE